MLFCLCSITLFGVDALLQLTEFAKIPAQSEFINLVIDLP